MELTKELKDIAKKYGFIQVYVEQGKIKFDKIVKNNEREYIVVYEFSPKKKQTTKITICANDWNKPIGIEGVSTAIILEFMNKMNNYILSHFDDNIYKSEINKMKQFSNKNTSKE